MTALLSLLLMPISGATPIGSPPKAETIHYCYGLDHPAVMSVYDPALGGINCDSNCAQVATGPLEDWMYEVAGACPTELLGRTVYFPAIGHTLACVDNGPAIKEAWSERDERCVVYFDTLWHLEKDETGLITGAPEWTWWLIKDWHVIDWSLD